VTNSRDSYDSPSPAPRLSLPLPLTVFFRRLFRDGGEETNERFALRWSFDPCRVCRAFNFNCRWKGTLEQAPATFSLSVAPPRSTTLRLPVPIHLRASLIRWLVINSQITRRWRAETFAVPSRLEDRGFTTIRRGVEGRRGDALKAHRCA